MTQRRARADACDFVPAGLPGVITVAAADITHDATKAFPWSWSNYGQCVDIWAPGVEIESASPDCFECTAIYSGTSQATPLVSGLIASHLSVNAADDPDAVKKALQDNAAVNVLEVLGHPYDTTVNFFAQARSARWIRVCVGGTVSARVCAVCDAQHVCGCAACGTACFVTRAGAIFAGLLATLADPLHAMQTTMV